MENLKQTQNNDFITKFLEEDRANGDWIRIGAYFRRSVLPPKPDANTKYFRDGLINTIKNKLKETLLAQEDLVKTRKRRIKLTLDNIPEKNRWFFFELEAHLFSEYYVVSKWIDYWLRLWDKIHGIPIPRRKNGVSENEIEKAKNHPVENTYQGRLQKSGTKLSGLCPFHKDNSPSFFIYTETNTWHCFGCSQSGDSISFAMKTKNINFVEAVRHLAYGHN